MKKVKQAVILAGGKGVRLEPFTLGKPKPMYEFNQTPFLSYLLLQIKQYGITDVVLLLGYMAEVIINYYHDGSQFGMRLSYDVTPVEYDTGSRLRHAQNLFQDEFLLMYCDNFCPLDFEKMERQFFESKTEAQITAYANKDAYTKGNLIIRDGIVKVYDKSRRQDGLEAVDIGYVFLHKNVISAIPDENVNFEECLYPQLVQEEKLGAFMTEHRYYSVGSWARIYLTKEFFKLKKAVFIDRDGTLNVKPPKAQYVTKPEQFIWLDGAKEAVRLLHQNGYLLFLFTNQPGIARGAMTQHQLDLVHLKMQTELQENGGCFDQIYMCTHGWDENCECRKPKPGLLYQAQKEWSLNLLDCIVIGDDDRDMEAGEAAGCMCYQVNREESLLGIVKKILASNYR
jgi:D-glycero-D-manno-heptose 1,7-bisphosphate phosphatase